MQRLAIQSVNVGEPTMSSMRTWPTLRCRAACSTFGLLASNVGAGVADSEMPNAIRTSSKRPNQAYAANRASSPTLRAWAA
jgi:hypothetical protein